jgi:hypothetical protein
MRLRGSFYTSRFQQGGWWTRSLDQAVAMPKVLSLHSKSLPTSFRMVSLSNSPSLRSTPNQGMKLFSVWSYFPDSSVEDTWITGPLPLCNLQLQICGAVHSEHVLVWRKSGSVSSFPTWCLNQCAKWTHLYSVDTKDTHCMIFQSFYLPLTVTPLFSICQLAIHQQFQVRAVYWVIARVS